MTFSTKLSKAVNEKDVENIYRGELSENLLCQITSPYQVDGLLESKSIRSLLEFKYDERLKNKLSQCNVLIQCLYYLKKFENAGDKLPTTIFVGDINECFAIHTNSIVKYLSSEIDWKIAPSEAHKRNPALIQAMVGDENILPFIYDVDDSFSIKSVIEKIKDFSDNVVRKVRVTKHNIVAIFDYFNKNVISNVTLTTNQKANLFIQIIVNPNENYAHPKKKNTLITKAFGEVAVNQNLFNSFFSHFEGDIYSPKEKEALTALVDRLVEDTTRRNKGEFFTPTAWVDEAHKMITDSFGPNWKEEYIVWDSCCATLNLTRDYKFANLFCSTQEQSDIDTANQMGYNPEATKFQFDFLNDSLFDSVFSGQKSKLPLPLQTALQEGKKILFLINPPYATANNMGTKEGDHKAGVSKTVAEIEMKELGWGKASQNLYAQFMFRIAQVNKSNVELAVFSPSLYKTGESYKEFRAKFYNKFKFDSGMIFNASHFSDTADSWAIDFSIWKSGKETRDELPTIIKDTKDIDGIITVGEKDLYNLDNHKQASKWVREEVKGMKTDGDAPQLTSAIGVKTEGDTMRGSNVKNHIGYFLNASNNIYENTSQVSLFSHACSKGNGLSVIPENFSKVCNLFTARKSISSDWINQKDEYLAPNESHPEYEQFSYDSIVYALFNNSSQQSSLRNIDYKNKKWDIKNEFFWMSKSDMLELAEANHYDTLYKDARTADERFVYTKLYKEGVYEKLSPDAKALLDMATELVKKSIPMRKLLSENHPEYHLDSWDSGYAQLKLVWKEYFKEEFTAFRDAYKAFENRLRPLVYEVGFLRK